jgi:nitrite reductase/ring-hydroxylating ferredoxin subunit
MQQPNSSVAKESQLLAVMPQLDLHEGTSVMFRFEKHGEALEGFVIRHHGNIYAYLNLCPHASEPIIDGTQSAFNSDKRYIVCREHFAMFNPETGACVSGPCPIADLYRLPVIVQGDMIFIST